MNYGGNGKEQLKLTVGRICQSVLDAAWTVLLQLRQLKDWFVKQVYQNPQQWKRVC